MSMTDRPIAARLRSRPLVIILLLTLGLAGVLTYEAYDAARRLRRGAEHTLVEYAGFAAWEFNISAKEGLYSTIVWLLSPVMNNEPQKPGAPLASPAILAASFAPRYRCDSTQVPALFRVDIADGNFVTAGAPLGEHLGHWVKDTVLAEVRGGKYMKDATYQAVFGRPEGTRHSLIYQVKWDMHHRPVAAYGFVFCLNRFIPPSAEKVLLKYAILPPSITMGVPNDSLFSVVVRDGQGDVLFRSPVQYESPYHATNTLDTFGGLSSTITFRPDVAERLLIGGMPRSRLPILISLLALTLGLVVLGLRQLRREDELQRLRTDFIASVSHELRTPLAQLRMFAETLLLGRVRSDQERTRSLEIIDQESRRLSHLVENILSFSRAERRNLSVKLCEQEIAPHVREAVEIFGPVARARHVTVDTAVEDGLHARLDAGAMRQILLNLLDNAVKYGPVGQTVRVTLSRAGSNARLSVDDQGPGIPTTDRLRIWKAFQRLERDVNSAVAGSGIGLAVVCELVLQHGGKGWVEEAPGGGARFVVELPLEREEAA